VKRVRSIACGALVVVIASGSGSRIGLGAEPEARPARRQVELIIGAEAHDVELLEPSIQEMLAPKALTVVTTHKAVVTAQDVAAAIAPPKEATPSLARILLDFTNPGQGTLFLIDPRRGRVYVRRMTLPHGLDAVARASARFVVEQSIDAILEGRDIGVSREEFQRSVLPAPAVPPVVPAPRPPSLPATTPPLPNPTRLLLEGGYQLAALGSGEYQQTVEVGFGVRLARVQVSVDAGMALPVTIAGDGVQARLSTTTFNLSGAGRLLNAGRLSLLAGLRAGLDLTYVDPAVTTPELQPAPAFWAAGPSLQPFARIEWLFGSVSVALAVGADVHLLAERYTVSTGGVARAVFVPARVRPTAALLIMLF
jgi:hypothetical protein